MTSASSTSPSDTVRYGVIGSGMMGQEHIANLAALDGAVVTAIADPDPGSREVAAAMVGRDCEVYTDHRALIESEVCDAVVVASPNHTHRSILDDVLATDLAVLIDPAPEQADRVERGLAIPRRAREESLGRDVAIHGQHVLLTAARPEGSNGDDDEERAERGKREETLCRTPRAVLIHDRKSS